ncbi:MAG: hypothetical protein FWC36_10845 [Spirochaetes bacterium]|nr:hypothetical protein [Spirochaetota bacterium]
MIGKDMTKDDKVIVVAILISIPVIILILVIFSWVNERWEERREAINEVFRERDRMIQAALPYLLLIDEVKIQVPRWHGEIQKVDEEDVPMVKELLGKLFNSRLGTGGSNWEPGIEWIRLRLFVTRTNDLPPYEAIINVTFDVGERGRRCPTLIIYSEEMFFLRVVSIHAEEIREIVEYLVAKYGS